MRRKLSTPFLFVLSLVISQLMIPCAEAQWNKVVSNLLGGSQSGGRRQDPPACVYPRPAVPTQPIYSGPSSPVYGGQVLPTGPAHVVSSIPAGSANPSEALRVARNKTDMARAFFKTHQYADAKRFLDEVVRLVPDDTNAYQFRSLTLFAAGDFDQAAADAYDSIKLGTIWTAQVLNTIYPTADRYHQQLNRLVQVAETQPSMSTHFLLAYHYLMVNDLDRGRLHLGKVLELQPEEPLTVQLLATISPAASAADEVANQTPLPDVSTKTSADDSSPTPAAANEANAKQDKDK